jgi:hypothetical protein
MNELDAIVLTINLPEYGLTASDLGTVVTMHAGGEGFEVEFVTLDGETLAVVSLSAAQDRPVARHEIAHARPLAA